MSAPHRSSIATHLLPLSTTPACLLDVVGCLGCGGFLLDRHARVVSLNAIARRCLDDGLVLCGEHLSATDRDTDHRLQSLVGVALSATADASPAMSVAVRRSPRLPLVLRALRLNEPARRTASEASLLLLALDPEIWPEPPRDILTQTFGLTRAEAEVAIGIVCGRTLAEVAAGRDVKVGTARAHLKTVFSKTHTRNQAELTGILTRLAFLVPQTAGTVAPSRTVGALRAIHPAGRKAPATCRNRGCRAERKPP
jgi:DNA-binding CsgD family transcriptional regulator